MDDTVACKQRIARLLPRFLPVSRACVYEITPQLMPTRHVNHDGELRWAAAYREHFHRIDPCRPSRFARSATVLVASDRLMPLEVLTRTEYYRGFMQPMRALHKVELFFRDPAGALYAGLRVTRTPEQGPFSDDDLRLLRELQPLLAAALSSTLGRDLPGLAAQMRLLSEREREVAGLVLQGLSNKEICRTLGTGLPTVKTQLHSIFRKLGVAGRGALAAMALGGARGVAGRAER
jgi:DNA-binding CsgD family transcriptional regulator